MWSGAELHSLATLPAGFRDLLLEEDLQSPQKEQRTLQSPVVMVYKGLDERLQPLRENKMVGGCGEIIWLEFWWREQGISFSLTNLFFPQYPASSEPEDLAFQSSAFGRVGPIP